MINKRILGKKASRHGERGFVKPGNVRCVHEGWVEQMAYFSKGWQRRHCWNETQENMQCNVHSESKLRDPNRGPGPLWPGPVWPLGTEASRLRSSFLAFPSFCTILPLKHLKKKSKAENSYKFRESPVIYNTLRAEASNQLIIPVDQIEFWK